jgi:N-acetylglutamate synthase-like GNAT family acetyltransferase
MVTISVTTDIGKLIPFFIEQELEFEENEEYGEDELVKCWEALSDDGELVGGCALALREGEFICDGIATAPSVRGSGLGEDLLGLLTEEVRSRGGDAVYLVARAPGFFAKQGFEVTERKAAPEFFECFTCPQYKKTCFPEVMKLSLKKLRSRSLRSL